jgi:hypothetical protein
MDMKYKFAIFFAIILCINNNTYGHDKNNIFLNIGSPTTPLFTGWSLGLGYERMLNEKIALIGTGGFSLVKTIVADAGYGENKELEIDLLMYFRYYPFSTRVGKPFMDIGIGYTYVSMATKETKISNLFCLQGEIGWKFIIRRIFIQPWVGYNMSFGKINYPVYKDDSVYKDDIGLDEMGKYGFINLGLSFGFIF